MQIVSAPRLLVGGQFTGPASIVIEGGTVVEIRAAGAPGVPGALGSRGGAGHLRLPDGFLTPGIVDIQVNGGFGVDLAAADETGWAHLAHCLTAHGVTSFLPTFITAPVDDLRAGVQRAAKVRPALDAPGFARVLGLHLEGPFLSPRQAGVHDPALMRTPTGQALDALLTRDVTDALTMMTLAPELDGGIAAVRRLASAGTVVSVGHSDATAEQTRAAADAGATMVTHIFNAQRGLAHREPGVAGQALDDDRYYIGLIPDLLHVAPPVCRLIMSVAAHRVALVSDATAAAGMPPGRYELGGQVVDVSQDGLPRNADGRIAGSALCLDIGVRNLVQIGCDPASALDAATRVPADVLSRGDLGRLAPGAQADLVWWSEDLRVRRTWIGGELAYDAERDTPVAAFPH